MGLFDFLKDKGRDVNEANKGQEIRNIIQQSLGDQITDLNVGYDDGTVRLAGRAKWHAAKQKAVLIAGNIKGVEKVDDGGLIVDKSQNQPQQSTGAFAGASATAQGGVSGQDDDADFYTIKSGDTLSEIAKREYGDANQWQRIFQANSGVIDDPDKIYPGQTIRLPKK